MRAYDPLIAVKVELNQLSDKCADKSVIPDVGAKPKFPNWDALNEVCNHLSGKYRDIPHTPEEDAEFERLARNQQMSEFARIERNHEIALMANVIRSTVRTNSAEGIATRLFEAGYRFDSSAVCLK